jgi:hypothetical protein
VISVYFKLNQNQFSQYLPQLQPLIRIQCGRHRHPGSCFLLPVLLHWKQGCGWLKFLKTWERIGESASWYGFMHYLWCLNYGYMHGSCRLRPCTFWAGRCGWEGQLTPKNHGGINHTLENTDLEPKHVVWTNNHKDRSIGQVWACVEEIKSKNRDKADFCTEWDSLCRWGAPWPKSNQIRHLTPHWACD